MTHLERTRDYLRTTYRILISRGLAALILFLPLIASSPRPAHAWSARAQGSTSPGAPFQAQPISQTIISAAAHPVSALPDIGAVDVTSQILSVELDASQAAQLLGSSASGTFLVASGGIRDEYAASVAVTTDGGYVVTGFTDSYGAGPYAYDIFLFKYASDGTLSWARTVGGSGDDRAHSVVIAPDGGIIVAGSTNIFGNFDVLLLRYENNGTLSWANTAGSFAEDEARSVAVTTDGSYVVAANSILHDGYIDVADFLLLKFASNGTFSWARTADVSDYDIARSVAVSADGGYFMAGGTHNYSAGSKHFLLLKYDSNGTLSWSKTAGGSDSDYAFSVAGTADGGVIVAGKTDGFGVGADEVLLLKFAGNGTLSWARTAGSSFSDKATSVAQTPDGGYILAGATGGDALLLKYASNGTLSWSREISGGGLDYAASVTIAADGGYIVVGDTTSFGAGSSDVLLMKTDANGEIQDCILCVPAAPIPSFPMLILTTPVPSIGVPGIITYSYTPGGTSPSPLNAFLCGKNNFLTASGGSGMDMANSVAQTADGGYIVAGQTSSYGSGGYDIFLLKYAADGTLSWARTAGGGSNDIAEAVVVDGNEGGYLVAGYTGSFGAGGYDTFLLKYSKNGTLSWAKTVGGSGDDRAYAVMRNYLGNFIVAGRTNSYGAGGNDVLLILYASDGTPSWAMTVGGSGDDQAHSVAYAGGGDFIVAGQTDSFGEGGSDVLLLNYAWDGALSWAKTAGGSTSEIAFSVTRTPDGGYIVAGLTSSYGSGGYDTLLLKYTSSGSLSWTRIAGGTADDYARAVANTADGGYIVAGRTNSYGAGSIDVLLLKYTSSGSLSWARTAGGTGWDLANAVAGTFDGGYIVAGYTDSFGAGSYDLLLLKTDANGAVPGCPACAPASPDTISLTPSTSTHTVTTNFPSPPIYSPNPSTASPAPKNTFVCGWPYDIYLPLVVQ